MRIFNGTPHDVTIIDSKSVESRPEIRKLVSENPVVIAKIPSDGMLNVHFELVEGDPINGIPTRNKVRKDIDAIPQDADIAIVSGLYASTTDDPRAYTVIDPVYDTSGKKVIGCLAIGKVVKGS